MGFGSRFTMSDDPTGMSSDPYRPNPGRPIAGNETVRASSEPKPKKESRLDKRTSSRIYRLVTGYPVALTVFIVCTYFVLAWFGYWHHLLHHKFLSGKFNQHERAICQKEGMLLYVQKFMWLRAKSEI